MSWEGFTRAAGIRLRIVGDLLKERLRQHHTWGVRHHPDGTGAAFAQVAEAARSECQRLAAKGEATWQHVLREEVYEAFAETDPAKLRKELVEVAAVAIAWIEDIDTREGAGGR